MKKRETGTDHNIIAPASYEAGVIAWASPKPLPYCNLPWKGVVYSLVCNDVKVKSHMPPAAL